MKKLIQRQKVPKYFKTHYTIVFVSHFEESEPIQITTKNFEHFKDQCGDWYLTLPFSVGDYFFFGDCLAKVLKLGKRNAKMLDTNGDKTKIPLKTLLTPKYKEIKVKVPDFSLI